MSPGWAEHRARQVEQEVVLIYARAANGTIGLGGQLPWHIPADLKRFKRLTMGTPMVMGRKTFDGFPAPLPGRRHLVLTRDPGWQAAGAEVVRSVGEALEEAGSGVVSVIGGAEIFALFMPLAHRVELTEVHADYAGDTHLPALHDEWREIAREDHPAEAGVPGFSFVTLVQGQ